jgi:CheY-like chemotaxis protein
VQRATAERYDVVFMDTEMPVLDGFGATALIREEEKRSDRRTPIVALTDPATAPDRMRYARAGMDDILGKPPGAEQLAALLECFGAAAPGAAASQEDAAEAVLPRAAAPPVDNDQFVEQTGGDPDLALELIETFRNERTRMLEPVLEAVDHRDPRGLAQAAHQLEGAFGSLAAPRAAEAARRLGRIARTGKLDEAPDALTALRAEVDRLDEELESIVRRTS